MPARKDVMRDDEVATAFEYATSHPIERIVHGGRALLRKDLRREALLSEARGCKPAEVSDPRREPAVYRSLLAPSGVGPALAESGVDWILIEQVPGPVLWQVGEFDVWAAVAAWLPSMHDRLDRTADLNVAAAGLLIHDRGFHQRWLEWAEPRLGSDHAQIAAAHAVAVDRVLALPLGVIHGELYPSNVMVAGRGDSLQVWPIDWEMAAVGARAMDLAALTAGWDPPQRAQLVAAYADAAGLSASAVRDDVDACRLLQAVQWLGWARGWQPPLDHRQDWLGIARELAGL